MKYSEKAYLVALACSILLSCKTTPFEKTIVGSWKLDNIDNAGDSVSESMDFTASNKWKAATIVNGKSRNCIKGTYEITNLTKYLLVRSDSMLEENAISEVGPAGNDSAMGSVHIVSKMVKVDTTFKYQIVGYDENRFELREVGKRGVFRFRRISLAMPIG